MGTRIGRAIRILIGSLGLAGALGLGGIMPIVSVAAATPACHAT